MLSVKIWKRVQFGAVLAHFKLLGFIYIISVGLYVRFFIIEVSEAIFALRLFVRFLVFKLTPFIRFAVLRLWLIEISKTSIFVVSLLIFWFIKIFETTIFDVGLCRLLLFIKVILYITLFVLWSYLNICLFHFVILLMSQIIYATTKIFALNCSLNSNEFYSLFLAEDMWVTRNRVPLTISFFRMRVLIFVRSLVSDCCSIYNVCMIILAIFF